MKFRLMAATAALALMTGAASAQMWTADQDADFVTKASAAGGEVIPSADTDGWEMGATVPDDYVSEPVEGQDDYTYVQDDNRFYIMDADRKIVHMVDKTKASDAGGQVTPDASGDPVSEPTQGN